MRFVVPFDFLALTLLAQAQHFPVGHTIWLAIDPDGIQEVKGSRDSAKRERGIRGRFGWTNVPAVARKPDQNQFDFLATASRECFRLNFRSKSGQNSFKTLAAMSTPSCIPSLDVASLAVRLFA